jgi:hypothetical protein
VEEDYTYSISKVWWTDSIDANFDRYATSRRLNFTIRVLENVSRRINARIFHKLHEASSYTFYSFLGERDVQGGNVDNNFSVAVGSPNTELIRGIYDFKIEVFETRSNRTEVVTTPVELNSLGNQKFEESTKDKNFSINIRWVDTKDRNENGYYQNARLRINVDVDAALEKSINLKLLYKPSSASVYQLYHTFTDYKIFGNSLLDTVSCFVGSEKLELEYGAYDFRIELYETGRSTFSALADETTPELNDVKFEKESDDEFYYTLSNIAWSNAIDLDSDTYTQFRRLNFKIDVDKNVERTLFAKLYYRHPDSSDYSRYDSTAHFKITGKSATNTFFINVGTSKVSLDSSKYDFLISIYEPSKTEVEAFQTFAGASTDTLLRKQRFELPQTDVKK